MKITREKFESIGLSNEQVEVLLEIFSQVDTHEFKTAIIDMINENKSMDIDKPGTELDN
jgi:hypothetical protein